MQAEQPAYNIGGLIDWTGLVAPGGAWDYKSTANPTSGGREFYFFGNQLVNAYEYGNLAYGYTGTAGGFNPTVLDLAAGAVQVREGRSSLDWYSSYFDNPANIAQIQTGINAYNSGVINTDISEFSSPSVQTRTSAVSSFNSASGASSPASQLWTTPNGAVVTWTGTVVSPGVSSGSK